MAMGGNIMEFVQRFQTLQMHRDSYDELIKDLLVYSERIETGLRSENHSLATQLHDANLDLSDATKSRRDLQEQLHQLEAQTNSLSQENIHLKNNNPYVVVLIDGDGLLFKENFIRQGIEGGKQAAYALRTAILKECGQHASGVEVIAQVFANLEGLARAMRRDGSLDSESSLKDFSLGFTQGKATFDFVDVGHGKERADNKIKETTKWNLRNYNCKQVILGISHDAGYAPFLDELCQDESDRMRITILEGFPTVRELVATRINILNLTGTLFRSEKLVDKIVRNITPPAASVGVIGSMSASSVASTTSIASVTSGNTVTPATSTTSTPATSTAPTYARAIKNASPPPQITLPIQPRPVNVPRASQVKPAPWNPTPRGLDPPINVSQPALDSIKKRKDSNKLCNNHYLRGPCAKGDSCCFEHKYKPTKEEIAAIAFLTRLNPCANEQNCEVEDCIYGHHCPSVRDGACTHPYCKFPPELHPPGTKLRVNKAHDY
ncbi:hypothetical protein B0T22DRAFT_501279 [Podospora appendiculata]|uniref:C3H1-type domain-containing protein n=1 Tax=Podospora appendiculata TaxID=314037 RepID=A0AAE0X3B0_9PEZI|nr:hypothetical protein B0T22DRAFT_501279 [Podospora appendiculata]